ncbi:twin-arginine translocation signal domain-containing protein [Phenylobacterium sp. J367]|uniref:twin-arginine translocation signal domain-containing protein n=1 Tax=Phenylobacterium sp. J367 TaxID=2898435 RepID=UPI002151A73D|nr:twin-arginine translocation signal domain-containing protein [Phenylobacterium sp. J367]MCR5878472.1 twin-arginine translocation signal domain-containing protein [Phenylobacterium sp. J367]
MVLSIERRGFLRTGAAVLGVLAAGQAWAQQQAAPPAIPPLSAAQAEQALAALRDAELHGLKPTDYLPEGFEAAGELTPEQQGLISQGLLAYAHDVRVGRLQLGDFPNNWTLRPAPLRPAGRVRPGHRRQPAEALAG